MSLEISKILYQVLQKMKKINITFNTREKKTQPKKKVTEEELSNYLKNPFRTEKTTEDEECIKLCLKG